VVFAQNHDQIGNRVRGDRLSAVVGPEALRLTAVTVLLSPYVPLLFMGEEYGETAPFPYFTSHGDADLVRAVREGRKREFAGFDWEEEPPDPQSEETFRTARLQRELREREGHRGLLALHQELLRLRREHPALASRDAQDVATVRDDASGLLTVRRRSGGHECVMLLRYAPGSARVTLPLEGRWRRVLDAAEARWDGSGTVVPASIDADADGPVELGPWAAVVLERG
jgi:maltooligosyltrehalose trehalohydrolase